MRDNFLLRLLVLGVVVFAGVALWRSWPDVGALWRSSDEDATPRAVLARGDLAMHQDALAAAGWTPVPCHQ